MPAFLRCRGNNGEGLVPPSPARSSPTRPTKSAGDVADMSNVSHVRMAEQGDFNTMTIRNLLLGTIAVTLLAICPATAAERVCSGPLTDMRVIGITIGDCDLNSISEEELKRVTNVCGAPGSIDAPTKLNAVSRRAWRAAVSSGRVI
jgi:hypothetical protein